MNWIKKFWALPMQIKIAMVFILLMGLVDFTSSVLSTLVDTTLGAVVVYLIVTASGKQES